MTFSEDEFFPSSALFRRQATSPIKRNGRSLARRKEELALFIVVALLVIAVCVSTGFLVLRSLAKPEAIKKWSYKTGIGVAFSPVLANGIVYALFDNDIFDNHTLYALDAVSGHEKWAYQTDGGSWSSPLVVNGMTYLDSKDGNLYALDALLGHKLWTRQLGGDSFISPTVANSMVYVISDDLGAKESTLYALDAVTGHEKWAYQETNSTLLNSQPTVANGTVYLASSDGTLDALDAVTGHKEWSFQVGKLNPDAPEPIEVNGIVYVRSTGGTLHALDAASGREEWSFQVEGFVWLSPTVANGIIYMDDLDQLDAIQPPGMAS